MKNPLKEREEKAYKAGEGVWFRNSDELKVWVEVSFYPKLKLWIHEDGTKRSIPKAELEECYHRLRL